MNIKHSILYLLLLVLLAFHLTYGQNEISAKTDQTGSSRSFDSRIELLMPQVRELFEAFDKQDCAKFVELSHPNIYQKKSKAEFFDEVRFVIESMAEITERLPSTVEIPNEVIEVGNQIFAVVPYKLSGINKVNKAKVEAQGSMVAISEDNGKIWKFVKGIKFNDAFPEIAGMIVIPNPIEKRFLNGVEQ
jgi:membrane carboxypeptidase/penicillin-binding protein